MKKIICFFAILCILGIRAMAQGFAEDMKSLVEAHRNTPNYTNLSLKEAVHLQQHASVAEIITVVRPYISTGEQNIKNLCWALLSTELFKPRTTPVEKQEIIQMLCENYLGSDMDLQTVDNPLLLQNAVDFNRAAKKNLAGLIEDGQIKYNSRIGAKLLAMAQVTSSIPVIQSLVNRNINKMELYDADLLAALARMGDDEAATLLCNYYKFKNDTKTYWHVKISDQLAFSMHPEVLKCLIDDFLAIDPNICFGDNHAYFFPAKYLAGNIINMLRDYPGAKHGYDAKPEELRQWLKDNPSPALKEK